MLPAHALLETYATLTRLPAPYRFDASVIADLLGRRFPPSSVLVLGAPDQEQMVERLYAAGVTGGASYDGVVGTTSAAHGAELLTNDRRARATYEALGVPHRMLIGSCRRDVMDVESSQRSPFVTTRSQDRVARNRPRRRRRGGRRFRCRRGAPRSGPWRRRRRR